MPGLADRAAKAGAYLVRRLPVTLATDGDWALLHHNRSKYSHEGHYHHTYTIIHHKSSQYICEIIGETWGNQSQIHEHESGTERAS